MRFEVLHPAGAAHEVELQGTVASLGRDPACEVVLNDPKCSRRHAVVEAGPQGMVIRDNGSANGIYLNGKKTDRANIKPGDVLKLGDVQITVLSEDIPSTMVMEDVEAPAPTRTTSRDPPPAPPRMPATPSFDRPLSVDRRPLTVTVLAVLWLISLPLYAASGLLLARGASTAASVFYVLGGLFMASLAGLMAWGLWSTRAWARPLQIVIAALGVFVCPFTLASIAVLAYMLQPAVRTHFSRGESGSERSQAEAVFAAAVVGLVALGAILVAALTFLARTARSLPS